MFPPSLNPSSPPLCHPPYSMKTVPSTNMSSPLRVAFLHMPSSVSLIKVQVRFGVFVVPRRGTHCKRL